MAQIFQKPILFFTNKIAAYSCTITQTDCWSSKWFLLHHCHKQKLFPPVFVSFLCQRFKALTVLTILLNALRRLMALFTKIASIVSAAIAEMLKSKANDWMASHPLFIQELFNDLCWESWVTYPTISFFNAIYLWKQALIVNICPNFAQDSLLVKPYLHFSSHKSPLLIFQAYY